jgi:urease accessory protein
MLVAREYLGRADDPDVAARLGPDPRRVVLTDVERRRSRVRTETTAGTDLGIVVARDLRDGDVLATDDGPVVVDLAPVAAVAFDPDNLSPVAALELGHAVGNRHLDLTTRDGEALVRATEGGERTAATVDELLPDGASTRVVSVSPAAFDGETPDHAHAGDHQHQHPHSHDHAGDGGHG